MRSTILMGCLSMFSIAIYGQENGRVRSGSSLRWSVNSSIEIMDGDLTQYYGTTDSNKVYKLNSTYASATLGDPRNTRFSSVQAYCDQNSVQLTWVAVQQHTVVDRYEIEQSSDRRNWTNIGIMPANRTSFGETPYSFNYTKNASNVLFRISAVNSSGERAYSSIMESPCSTNSYLAVTPNPVYSNTTLRVGSWGASKVKLMLINSSGVVVQTKDASLLGGTNQLPVDMSSLSKGFYSLVIQWTGGKQDILKVVKQ